MQAYVDRYAEFADTSAARRDPTIGRFPARTAAFLSDIHANVPAFAAVVAELATDPPDVVVLNGDITWGTFPSGTVDLIERLRGMVRDVVLIRGNGDRAVLELHDGTRSAESPRDGWMVAHHTARDIEVLRGVVFQVDVDIAGFGVVRACHGSPRADVEIVTPATPLGRLAAATADVDADVLLTGHTHLQFHRHLDGMRVRHSVNPGSVGIPYGGSAPGAYWLRIDPTRADPLDFRCTGYDVEAYLAEMLATDDPGAERVAGLLRAPLTHDELIAYSEALTFSD